MTTQISGDTGVSQVQDGTVSNADLADNAVTSSKILNGTIQAGDFDSTLFAMLTSTNGYQKLPSGLIIQWGGANTVAGSVTVTLPIAFPNAVFQAVVSSTSAAVIAIVSAISTASVTIYTHDHTGAAAAVGVRWIAIGY